jgi:poly-gamma-glutamate synthesis protein (capsule biosynthesis protein)
MSSKNSTRAAALALALTGASLPAASLAQALEVQPVPAAPMAGTFTFAAVGDLIYLRPMLATIEKQSPAMLKLIRDADVAFGNFETSVFDFKDFKGSPQAESGGTWMLGDVRTPKEVARMGFDIVSRANNHGADWGVEGMADTDRHLDDAGLVHSGTGRSMASARAPQYLDVGAGRVGLVAATTSFTPMSRAADGWGEAPARPGVNAIRSERSRLVAAEDLPVLARVAKAKEGKPVILEGVTYRAASSPALVGTLSYALNPGDEAANLLAVRQAHQNGNFTVFSLHNHEPGNGSQTPADFAVPFAHKIIDAGADAYIGHGPHQLRGIEIYKGKPIFYSLGNFAMMNNSLDVIPLDMFQQFGVEPGSATTPEVLQARNAEQFGGSELFESVIAINRYEDGRLSEIRLYPIELGIEAKGAARGVPRLADATTGARTLARLQKLSQPFGTTIAVEKGVGVIRLP